MSPWLILALVAAIIIGLVWACCAVGGAADDRMDDELDSAFARARFDRTLANYEWKPPFHSIPDNTRSSNGDGMGGLVDHEGLDK